MLSNITSTLQIFKGDIAAPSIFDVTNSGELFAGFAVGGLGMPYATATALRVYRNCHWESSFRNGWSMV